jgi:hypothetical protein
MPSTNGHGPRRAGVYRRVSGEEQKKKGYSLPDQRAEALEYCAQENLEVVREFEDAGYSGKFLEPPTWTSLETLWRPVVLMSWWSPREIGWPAVCRRATSRMSSSGAEWS